MQFEFETLDDDLRVAWTKRLEDEAFSLDVPISSEGEFWGQHRTSGEGYLKDAYRQDLRQQIGRNRKEKRDSWKDILLLLSGVAALVQLTLSMLRSLTGH